jgi:hypothetical protein
VPGLGGANMGQVVLLSTAALNPTLLTAATVMPLLPGPTRLMRFVARLLGPGIHTAFFAWKEKLGVAH